MSNHNVAIGLLEYTLNGGARGDHAEQLLASIELLRHPPVETKSPFEGDPNDWWERAEQISMAEAENRKLGNWYIIRQRTAGKQIHSYRLMTPSRPPLGEKILKAEEQGKHRVTAEGIRVLIRGEAETPAWMTSRVVIADFDDFPEGPTTTSRQPWVRKNGRWQAVYDGRRSINDHAMAELNPVPASIQEV